MSRRSVTRRAVRRRDTDPVRRIVVRGVLTLGIIALFVGLSVTVQSGTPGKDYSTLYVAAEESGSLRTNDRVAIGGVRVGRVVGVTPSDDRARIELQLEPGVALPKDTKVRIRANGLLGARFVQLIPGTSSSRIADGATVVSAPDALTASVPDALDVFNAETRGALGTAVTGLGTGLLGNGSPLNDGIDVASDATVPFAGIMDSIRLRGEPEQLVPSLDSGVGALSDASPDLRRMLGPAADALDPFGDRAARLRETLDVAPSALAASRAGLSTGTRLLAATGGLARSASRTLPSAPAGLRQASALLREARTGGDASPLARAADLLDAAEPAVPAALRITRSLRPLLPNIDDALGSLGPVLRHVGRYSCDFINTGVTLRSMTGFVGTGTGPNGPSSQFRLQAVAGAEALGIPEGAQLRDAYYEPCTYLGREYNVPPTTSLGLGGR